MALEVGLVGNPAMEGKHQGHEARGGLGKKELREMQGCFCCTAFAFNRLGCCFH